MCKDRRIYNHVLLGEVYNINPYLNSNKASCRTLADNILYEVNLIDLIDY